MVIVQYILHAIHCCETSWWFRWQKVLGWNKIVRLKWFLKRTVVGDCRRFKILSGSHLHSEPTDGWKFKGGQWPPTVPLDRRTQFNREIKFYPSVLLLGSYHFLWQRCFLETHETASTLKSLNASDLEYTCYIYAMLKYINRAFAWCKAQLQIRCRKVLMHKIYEIFGCFSKRSEWNFRLQH